MAWTTKDIVDTYMASAKKLGTTDTIETRPGGWFVVTRTREDGSVETTSMRKAQAQHAAWAYEYRVGQAEHAARIEEKWADGVCGFPLGKTRLSHARLAYMSDCADDGELDLSNCSEDRPVVLGEMMRARAAEERLEAELAALKAKLQVV